MNSTSAMACSPACNLPPLFDSHSHINAPEFDIDRDAVLLRMRQAGLVGAVVVGCDRPEIDSLKQLVAAHPDFLLGAWALHPEYEDRAEVSTDEIIAVCDDPLIGAVGETGLDYHWCKGDLSWQKQRFVRHIQAACELNKPIIVHAREAESDALDILAANNAAKVGFVLHCYGGDLDTALRCIDLGGFISVTGVVTFKNALGLQEVVRALPLDRLMIETDCPYMAPVPHRGHRNEPTYVEYVARKIAELKQIDYETVATVTSSTAAEFFSWKV